MLDEYQDSLRNMQFTVLLHIMLLHETHTITYDRARLSKEIETLTLLCLIKYFTVAKKKYQDV